MAIVIKRNVMSLFSDYGIYSHLVRIILAEKGISVEVNTVDAPIIAKELLQINPYGSVPTLVDRELALYDFRVIIEYLDERFPHPPLLPVYPVARAEIRKMAFRIEKDWYTRLLDLENNHPDSDSIRYALTNSILELEPVFASKPFFLNDEFSLLDCALSPLLWRLGKFGITIPEEACGIRDYMTRMFKRPAFIESLLEQERQSQAA